MTDERAMTHSHHPHPHLHPHPSTTKRVGILGGGQLGRMLALAGYPLGLRFRVLDPSPHPPTRDVAEHIAGAYDDPHTLHRFADGVDVITYEFENVPLDAVRTLARTHPVYPPPDALAAAQDRLAEKTFFQTHDIPTATFAAIESRDDLERTIQRYGLPAVVKTRRMGYDGKGQHMIYHPDDADAAWENLGGRPLLLESVVPFERELSIIAVRGCAGETAFYPLVENTHRNGILWRSLAPAPHVSAELQATAERYATQVLDSLNYVGVLAIELFQVNTMLLANEMAPRVHNSGHWTIEGAVTSQFANHLRAIIGAPLGSTAPRGSSALVNIIGTLPDVSEVLALPGAGLHLYDKAPRPGRKLGHITLCGSDLPLVLAQADELVNRPDMWDD